MSTPEPDIFRRGQEIFERLRSSSIDAEPPPDEDQDEMEDEETAAASGPSVEAEPEVHDDRDDARAPEQEPAEVAPAEPPPVDIVPLEPTSPGAQGRIGAATEAADVAEIAVAPLMEPEPVAEEAKPDPVAVPPGRAAHPASLRPLPRVMAVANQKGGVGKTTTAVNLGAGLAELGYRVLIVDLDPQGNATTGLGVNPRNLDHSVYDVLLHDVPLDDCVEPTAVRNLFVAPATIDLAGADIELVPAFSRELRLRRAIEGLDDAFDYTIIDCPPSLGLITVNGLAAANEVVVPIQCEYYALEGVGQLLKNVNLVTANLNPKLEISAIVLTMYDSRTKLAEQVAQEVRNHFGDKVCRMVIPRTVRLSEAPSFGQPILTFDPTSRGAVAYRELAKEVSGGAP